MGCWFLLYHGEYRQKNERRTQKCYNHARTTTPQPLLPTRGCAGTMRRNRWKADGTDAGSMNCILSRWIREAKEVATSEYVVANRDGGPLSYTQFKRVWQYIVTRSTKERTYVRYINGQKIQRTVTPKLGEKAAHNGNVVYTLDFQVTPHQLRHTYITNLIYSGADPKTVQYLAGHKHSKITMDIYAKVKYNKPKELSSVVNKAFAPKKGATPNKTRNG